VAGRCRCHQFPRIAGFAFSRSSRSRTFSRSNLGLQGFWRAFHGPLDGLFCTRRI
jgi:hypothetical protein